MPNWCSTRITINHNDNNELEKLENLIDEWTSKNYTENGFGTKWLGNIVLGSGIGTVDTDINTDIRCRGSLCYMERMDGQLVIDTETAWSPMLKMWTKIIDKYLPDAEFIFTAEECGCGIYDTNDECLIGKYIVDCWDDIEGKDEIESNWEADEEYVIDLLNDLFDTKEANVDKLIRMFEDSDYTDNMSIHKWEFVEDLSIYD